MAEEGAVAALVQALNYVTPDWLFCAYCGYVTRNDLTALPGYRGTEVVRWATPEDLHDLKRFEPYCDDLPGWIARGDRFVVALRDGEIVGFENYQGRMHRFVPVPWVCVDLADDELWAVFSLVDPRFRGQGIVGDLVNFASAQLRKDGYRFIHGHTAKGDASAARAHTKRGFLSIDNWRIYRVSGTTYFSSRLVSLKGRWTHDQALKVRVKDASGGIAPAERDSSRKADLTLAPTA